MEPEELREQLQSLDEVSQALRNCSSIEEVVQKALREVRERLDVQVASIFLISKDGLLKREGIEGVDKAGQEIDNSWFPDEQYTPGQSFSGQAVPKFDAESNYGKPVYSNRLTEEYPDMLHRISYLEKLGELQSGISVPLNDSDGTFGTLVVFNKQKNIFFSADIYWLTLIGTSVANFIVDFRHRQRLSIYGEINLKLVTLEDDKNFDLPSFYQDIANRLTEDFTPYKACIIRIVDERDDLEIRGKSSNLEDNFFWQGRKDGSYKSGDYIVGQVYKHRQPIFIRNIDDIGFENNNKDWSRERQLKSFACLPLSIFDKCVGTISVYTQYPYKFSVNYKSFLENMAFLTAAITAKVWLINNLRRVRQEQNENREKMLNTVILVGHDQISKNILHQYKNELLNFSQFLEKITDDSNISNKERQRLINEQLQWIARRVDEIQPELQQADESTIVDINATIKEVVERLSFEFSPVNLKIVMNFDDAVPSIVVNEREIKDIIFNLLSNAEKAIKEANEKKGKIEVTTSIDAISEPIEYIQITVEDNGTGIDNKIRDKIFQRRFTTREKKGGSGLGLFVVRQILESLGGKIYFESSVKGTKFYVKIPWKRYQC